MYDENEQGCDWITDDLPGIVQAREQELSLIIILRLPGAECLDEAAVSDILSRGAMPRKSAIAELS